MTKKQNGYSSYTQNNQRVHINAYTYGEDQRDWERLGEIERERESEMRLGFKRGY